MPIITGTEFEEYSWSNWWLRNFPTTDWSREPQVALAGRYKVDFVAYRVNERAIGNANDKGCLTFQDVEKLIEDAGIYKARWLYLMIAADTRIPCNIQDYADDDGPEIIRTRWRAKTRCPTTTSDLPRTRKAVLRAISWRGLACDQVSCAA
jgi:hypothetical protein